MSNFVATNKLGIVTTELRPPGVIKVVTRTMADAKILAGWINSQYLNGMKLSCEPEPSQRGFTVRLIIPPTIEEPEEDIQCVVVYFWQVQYGNFSFPLVSSRLLLKLRLSYDFSYEDKTMFFISFCGELHSLLHTMHMVENISINFSVKNFHYFF